jgi:DNA polymerase III psi subunit
MQDTARLRENWHAQANDDVVKVLPIYKHTRVSDTGTLTSLGVISEKVISTSILCEYILLSFFLSPSFALPACKLSYIQQLVTFAPMKCALLRRQSPLCFPASALLHKQRFQVSIVKQQFQVSIVKQHSLLTSFSL